MKKILFLFLLLPLLSIAQEKNVVISVRIFPKLDKVTAFEKALANHHMKYHSGLWKASVFSMLSGPDAGAYQVTMGPLSWEDIDSRNPSKEHDMDWDNNVLPLVDHMTNAGYAVYDKDMSTVNVGDFVEKVTLFHVYPKVGKWNKVSNIINRAKADWVANNKSVAVYTMESSGEGQYVLVTRHKNGWKEKGEKPVKTFKESLGGDMQYNDFMDDVSANIERTFGEMMTMRKDLSSAN
jgi:hypothetical protein